MGPSQDETGTTGISRRKFVQVGSVSGVSVLLALCVPVSGFAEGAVIAAESSTGSPYPKRIYRAGPEGRILMSDDNERTWQVHANFGPDQIIRRVSQNDTSVIAEMGVGSRTFELYLHELGNYWVSRVF